MDIIRDQGFGFLGSRLKRLGERLQAGAAGVTAAAGLPVQPAQIIFLRALEGSSRTIGELVQAVGITQPGVTRTIGQLVELGMVRSDLGVDQRQRVISLTPEGALVLARAQMHVLPRVEDAVRTLLGQDAEVFMAQIAALEAELMKTPIEELAARSDQNMLTIWEYRDDLAHHFSDINAEWIDEMFHLEDTDRAVLANPREHIIDVGGTILFVEARGLGIIGAGALRPSGDGGIELTKMGVRANARGLKAGEFLLASLIERAQIYEDATLYLLTNARCSAAIHLYEKLGFHHDAEIMAQYGSRYERSDVAMRYAKSRSIG